MLTLQNIRDNVRAKLAEDVKTFMTDDIVTDAINTILAKVAEEALLFEDTKKLLMPVTTDGINAPAHFIEVLELFVNNQRYQQVPFSEVRRYLGNDAYKYPDYVYYIRNYMLVFLNGLKQNDELTIYYFRHFDTLVKADDQIPPEFDNSNFKDLITVGACWLLKERDEDFQTAAYYKARYDEEMARIAKRNRKRSRGQIEWRPTFQTMSQDLWENR